MLKSKLVVGGLLVGAWLGACSGSEKNQFDCAVGQADCSCNADLTCAVGLVCNNRHQCVAPSGAAGRAGAGNAGGGDANGATGGATATNGGATTNGGSGGKSTGHGAAGGTKATIGDTGGDTSSAGDTSAGMSGEAGQASGGTTGGSGGATGGSSGAGAMSGAGGSESQGGGAGTGGTSAAGSGGTDTAGSGGTAGTGGANASGGAGNGGFAGGAHGGAGGTAGAGGNCTEITITSTMAIRDLTKAPNAVDYEYQTNNIGLTVGMNTADLFILDFYAGKTYDGDQTGTFTLGTGEEANYQTCARCALVDQDSGNNAEALFFASSGTLVVASDSDQMNGFPKVTLSDVTFVEVTINNQTFVSTPVHNGRCLHLASADVSFPTGWTCDPSHYSANDGCDCGCGVRDGDCGSAMRSACDTCNCSGDAHNCSHTSVNPMNNAVCQ